VTGSITSREASACFSCKQKREYDLPINLFNYLKLDRQKSRVVDPDPLNPDPNPAFPVNPDSDPIQIQSFDDQKMKKKNTTEIFFAFLIKNCNLTIPRPYEGCPSYRRSLQPSKENIQHFKK
jgi:hypothetical protein